MENKLLKHISSTLPKTKLDNVINKFQALKEKSNNFDKIFENDKMILSDNLIDIFYDFLYSFKGIMESVNLNDFSNELDDLPSDNEIKFWKKIILNIKSIKVINSQTLFLKNMEIDDFNDLITHTFNHYIMYNSITKEYKQWDKIKIRIAEKTIKTFLHCMILDFNDLDTALYYDLHLRFEFSKEKYQIIWDLCEKNKLYLMMKQITESIYSEEDE